MGPTAILLLLLMQSSSAANHLPQDPPALAFEVSPDHDATDANGPRVLKYLIDFLPVDGLGTAKTVDIGKPVPEHGEIRVPLPPLKLAPGRYIAQVRVQGQTMIAAGGSVGPFQIGKPKPRRAEEPEAGHGPDHAAPASAPEASSPGRKGGFWRRLYGLVVGQ
jgi:hypothetical protein